MRKTHHQEQDMQEDEYGSENDSPVTALGFLVPPEIASPDPVPAVGLAIIFDLDGVIINSMPVHELAWKRYLRERGVTADQLTEENLFRNMHGRRNDEIILSFLGNQRNGSGLSDDDIFLHGAAKEHLYREMMASQLEQSLVPGVREFMAAVGDTPMAVATNAERANADFVLTGANLRGFIRYIADGSQVEYAKPSPDIYLLAARQLGVLPHNCIVFEDSPVGIEAARRAGMRVAGIMTQASSLDDVDLAIHDFRSPALHAWLAAQRVL